MYGRYDVSSYKKHKHPKGWGSLCPHPTPIGLDPQALLDTGVRVDRLVYNVHEDAAFSAREHETGVWHGFPIPWAHLHADAVAGLIERGRLTMAQYRKAIRRSLGAEGER